MNDRGRAAAGRLASSSPPRAKTFTAAEQPIRGHLATRGTTGSRRRYLSRAAALAAAAAPAVVVAAALTTGWPALLGVAAVVVVALCCRLAVAAGALLVRRITFSRLPLDDQLPADLWAAVLAVPVASVLASGLAGGGMALWTLTLGPQAPLAGTYRGTAASAILVAGLIGVGVPTVAGYRIALQRRGEQHVLFNPACSASAIRHELARRRAALRSRRRWLLPQLRQRLVAAATAPAAGPPDPGRRQPPAVPPPIRAGALGCAGVVTAAFGVLAWPASATAFGSAAQAAAAVALTACLTALAIGADLYRLVLAELSEAAVLSRAEAALHRRGKKPAARPNGPRPQAPARSHGRRRPVAGQRRA